MPNRSLVHPLLTAVFATALGAGCGDSAMGTAPGGPCESMRDSCVANQMACVETSGAGSCQPCPAGHYATLAATCESLAGRPVIHDFAMFTVKAGEEVLGLCQSWALGNATELWVNAVDLTQDQASHHSNWTFSPSDKYPGPDGVWRCKERNYDQLSAALSGGVLYAQSTQAAHEVQHFPPGAAVRIPPWSRIIGDVHLLNPSPKDVTGHARMALYTLALADVKVKLVPFHLTFDTLLIPPRVTSRHYADCDVGDSFRAGTGEPWDLKVYYLLPHTHALGSRFFVEGRGGAFDKKPLIDVRGFNSEPRGRAYDPPLDLSEADGLRFGCEHTNPTDAEINWGFGDQEMCEVLGFGDSARAFESRVTRIDPAGSEGAMPLFTGGCGTSVFTWDHNKPGGKGP